MPISVPGSKRDRHPHRPSAPTDLAGPPLQGAYSRARPVAHAAHRGFTLIELMVVIALIGILTAITTMSIRDPASTQLEREATRLMALLESARSHSRVMGIAVVWEPVNDRQSGLDTTALSSHFAFRGLPPALDFPTRWLGEGVHAEVMGHRGAVLGPEPMIGPQRILLRLENQRLALVTDGLGPFAVEPVSESP